MWHKCDSGVIVILFGCWYRGLTDCYDYTISQLLGIDSINNFYTPPTWRKVSLAQYINELYHGVETTRGTFVVSHNGTSQDEWQYAVKENEYCYRYIKPRAHLVEGNSDLNLDYTVHKGKDSLSSMCIVYVWWANRKISSIRDRTSPSSPYHHNQYKST